MGTTTRPTLSHKNKFHIDRHRYYELKHFCLQYPVWKKAYSSLDGLSRYGLTDIYNSQSNSSPTERCVLARERYYGWMSLIEKACKETDDVIGNYILKAVTEGHSYDALRTRFDIPCCSETYYILYRKFFWILSQLRE